VGQVKRKGKFGPEMQEALRENNDFIQGILAHSCSAAADVLYGASQIGIIANQFAHEVGDGDPLREESKEVSAELMELIQGKLLNKDSFAVANALFWHASAMAAAALVEHDEEENDEPSEESRYKVGEVYKLQSGKFSIWYGISFVGSYKSRAEAEAFWAKKNAAA
jgi:hypothetical protein